MANILIRELPSEQATSLLADDLAAALRPGDLVALSGDLGAGKTSLARAIVRAIAGDNDLEVPSPTFTLVQSYETRIPVHHFDLYRLGSPDELAELGLDQALEDGIALVEWPERAGDRLPTAALTVALTEAGDGRLATITGTAVALSRIERSFAIRSFLASAGLGEARRRFLVGDASTRSYETVLNEGTETLIVMNAPAQPDGPPIHGGRPYSRIAHLAENVAPFVAVARTLREAGFAAPQIHAADMEQGFLLIEHLGSEGVLDAAGHPVPDRYMAAARLLAALHERRWMEELEVVPGIMHAVPAYDREAMAIETELLIDWYMPAVADRPADEAERAGFGSVWDRMFDRLDSAERSLVLRDFHSPNIIWREARAGHDRLGLIDFQDAVIGPSAYDVASLAMDARVDIDCQLETAIVEAYCAARDPVRFDRSSFDQAYAIMAAQRNSKILGIFVRLDRRDGKPHYLRHLPRIRDYLGRALAHPALGELAIFYRRLGIIEEEAS